MKTDLDSHLAFVCEKDILDLAERTNRWWYAAGGERPDLVHRLEIAQQAYRWALETGRPVRINHDHPSIIYAELGAAWDAEREAFRGEARRFVMELATWRRIVQEEGPRPPADAPSKVPESQKRVTVGSKGDRA